MASSEEETTEMHKKNTKIQTLKKKIKKRKIDDVDIHNSLNDKTLDKTSPVLSKQRRLNKRKLERLKSSQTEDVDSEETRDFIGNKLQTGGGTKKSKLNRKMKDLEKNPKEDVVESESKDAGSTGVESGENISHDEYSAIRDELSHMSFEELQKLKERLGMKVYNQVMKRGKGDKKSSNPGKKTFSRENKNRPVEMSSKRRVPVFREVVSVKKKQTRDPRFDDLSGNYNEAIFKSSYAFLDDLRKKESQKLEKQLKKTRDAKEKEEIHFLLNRKNQQEAADRQKMRKTELEKEWKKKEMLRVEEGKNPFFLKKGDLRKLELADKFKELKKSGKLEKYLSKKRKRNASKEKKKLPAQLLS